MRAPALLRSKVAWTIAALLLTSASISAWRLERLGWDVDFLVPDIVHDVVLVQRFEGHGEPVRLQTYLPQNDARQTVVREADEPGALSYHSHLGEGGRLGTWSGDAVTGPQVVRHRYRVHTEGVRFDISPDFKLPDVPPRACPPRPWLPPTPCSPRRPRSSPWPASSSPRTTPW